MLSQEVREILRLYLEYYSRLWKRQLTSRDFRIKHWLAREQFYRQNKLPREISDLIEKTIWLDFTEELRLSAHRDFFLFLTLENNTRALEEWVRKLIEKISKVQKNYSSLVFQITEQDPINLSLKLYQEKLEEFRAGRKRKNKNWYLLIELKNLANEEVNKETSFQWFLTFNELFHLLTNEDLKRISLEERKITHEEWEQIQKSNQQALEKIRRNCRKTKRQKIEAHIQKLASDYLKKFPKLPYSQEIIIVDTLGVDWKEKINEEQISNIENEKRDYEALFTKRSERFQRTCLLAGLYLIIFVYIFFFYPFYLYTKLYRKHKISFWVSNLSKEQQKKDKEISHIVAKKFFIAMLVWLFLGFCFNPISRRL